MDWKTIATLAVTVSLAFFGYVVTYLNNLNVSRRKERLDRINRQLKELYGPLFALSHASQIAWVSFRRQFRPHGPFWSEDNPPTPDEAAAWRIWMQEVFMPFNVRKEQAILANSDLVDEKEMPRAFIRLCAHVAGYKIVLKKWENEDYTQNVSSINYPQEIHDYVQCEFNRLKAEQTRLIGLRVISKWPGWAG